MYEKVKRSDENFIAIGFVEDERLIKDLNKKAIGIKKDDSIKEESKEEEGTQKRKFSTGKKMKSRKRRFRQNTSEDDESNSKKENDELRLCLTIAENDELRLCLTIAPDEYKEFDETKDLEEINLNVVIRSNGQRRYFSTMIRMLSIFNREDLNALYQLVMDRYQDKIPEVNTARQNLSSQAAATSTARKVNTARPIVNEIRLRNNFYKSHSPIRRPSNRTTAPKANFANHKVNTAGDKTVSAVGGNRETDDPQKALKNKGIIDSGCSRHMTRNKAYLVEYQDYNGGLVTFGGSKGQIISKGKIITGKLDYEDVYFVKELKQFNLFSMLQICDKKNKVLFTDSECLVLSPDFKLPDENQVLLGVPRQNNMYSFNLENIIPTGEFKNRDIIEFCGSKRINREYSNAKTPQQNGVAERKNKTLIEAARTMLADLFLPNTFWAKAETLKWKLNLLKNTLYCHYGLLYTSTVKSLEANNVDEKPNEDTGPKINEKPKDQEDLAFLEELERLKRQEKEANDAAKAFRKEFAQFNIVSTPISTASPSNVFSTGGPDLNNNDQDDSQIPALEDIYDNPSDGIFTNASYDDEGAVADFTNLETTMNEEGIDYDEVFAPVARIEAIRIFLAFASYMGFIVYQIDVKSAFLYSTIDEEVYMSKPPSFVDPKYLKKKSWCDEFEALMKSRFQMSYMGELTFFLGLQVKQKEDGIFISQDKSMIGSLMYLASSRHDIMFVVCACSRFQVTLKTSYFHAVKRIFRYLKGKTKLGLWYPRVLSFDLEAYSDSDYAGANLDRKSTTRESINFIPTTKILQSSSTSLGNAYEKKLIQVLKIHTDDNVADLLTNAFDVSRFNFLIVNIGILNQ
ncbi:ribonuclease H-like domain-containing protein [Tanacetum coccineum]